MDQAETNRFNELYQRHVRLLKLQGKSQKTIDAYARAVRRISKHFDCCPDQLTLEQREEHFSGNMSLNATGSGSTSSKPPRYVHCPTFSPPPKWNN
jgi:hypothetical protein